MSSTFVVKNSHSFVLRKIKEKKMSRSEALKFETCYQIKFDTVVRGHQVYKRIWTPIIKEKSQCFKDSREEANDYDKYAKIFLPIATPF